MRVSLPAPPPGWLSDVPAPGASVPASTIPGRAVDLGAWAIVGVVWLVVIGAALLVLRAICSEDLDRQGD